MSTTIPGPVVGTRISAEYAGQIARFAYFWAWPMVNMHNRLMSAKAIPAPGLAGGFLPVTPPNRLCMLRDYIDPSMRAIACPNQDLVYGQGFLDLEIEPVVIQIPDFGDRFWVYQAVDQRTDSFAELGAMYATQPGFYLLAHTDWDGPVPDGITEVFRCPTRIGATRPRLFMDDTVVDWVAIQPIINQINGYPLSEYDGHTKSVDWSRIPIYPVGPDHARDSETSWVDPETFFSTLPAVLDEVPPLAGEHSLYHQIRAMLDAARCDPDIDDAVTAAAHHSDRQLVAPLFEFSNYGLALPHHWTQVTNGAQFGTDYFTRTAVAKSSMFVNRSGETAYFYQDFDSDAARLTGGEPLFTHLSPESTSTCARLLVADRVQRAPLLPPQRTGPLLTGHEDPKPAAKRRRLADPVHRRPTAPMRRHPQLAARTGQRVLTPAARLLADRRDPRRALDASRRQESLRDIAHKMR